MITIHTKIAAWVESDYGSCPVSGTALLAFLDSQQAEIDRLRAERKPMTDDEIINLGNEVHRAMPDDSDDQEELLEIVREVEAHHVITKDKQS